MSQSGTDPRLVEAVGFELVAKCFEVAGTVRRGAQKSLLHARRLLGSQSPGPIGVGCHLSIPSPVR